MLVSRVSRVRYARLHRSNFDRLANPYREKVLLTILHTCGFWGVIGGVYVLTLVLHDRVDESLWFRGIWGGMLVGGGYHLLVHSVLHGEIHGLSFLFGWLIGGILGMMFAGYGGALLGGILGGMLGGFLGGRLSSVFEVDQSPSLQNVLWRSYGGGLFGGMVGGTVGGLLASGIEQFEVGVWIGRGVKGMGEGAVGTSFVLVGALIAGSTYGLRIIRKAHRDPFLCPSCLRLTVPHHAASPTTRYCTHCRDTLQVHSVPTVLILLFGNDQQLMTCRAPYLVVSNPEIEHRDTPLDVSVVCIDTATCSPRLLEQWLTHVHNFPPQHGLQAIQIWYRGNFRILGGQLMNAFQNSFQRIQQVQEFTLRLPARPKSRQQKWL
jgi:hypothetical protein